MSIQSVRLPSWRPSDYDPWEDSTDLLSGLFAFVVLAPLSLLVLPLLRLLVELPLAVGRSFFSSTRWIEARCRTPAEIRIVWRTSRGRAKEVANEISERLGKGYENLTIEGAKLVSMTEPPGFADLQS